MKSDDLTSGLTGCLVEVLVGLLVVLCLVAGAAGGYLVPAPASMARETRAALGGGIGLVLSCPLAVVAVLAWRKRRR